MDVNWTEVILTVGPIVIVNGVALKLMLSEYPLHRHLNDKYSGRIEYPSNIDTTKRGLARYIGSSNGDTQPHQPHHIHGKPSWGDEGGGE